MAAIWQTETDLMERLTSAQNHPVHNHLDIMSFAGMCDSRAELEGHVIRAEKRAAEYVQPKRRRDR